MGLAISEVKLRHKARLRRLGVAVQESLKHQSHDPCCRRSQVLSIDPRIAGIFSFTKTETSVANAVNFQFLIQASAVGAEDLNRMGTAVKIFEMGLKSFLTAFDRSHTCSA